MPFYTNRASVNDYNSTRSVHLPLTSSNDFPIFFSAGDEHIICIELSSDTFMYYQTKIYVEL